MEESQIIAREAAAVLHSVENYLTLNNYTHQEILFIVQKERHRFVQLSRPQAVQLDIFQIGRELNHG